MSFGKDPMIQRKSDNRKNGKDIDKYIEKQIKNERNLYPLRITKTTVIYVTKNKCTVEYAEKYRKEKLGLK